jgi:hypothetical protein
VAHALLALVAIAPGLALAALAVALGTAGCSAGGRARDVAGAHRTGVGTPTEAGVENVVPEAPRQLAQPVAIGKKPRVFVQASSRALALDAKNLYYGDNEDDGVFSIPKAGGSPVRLARHAPVAGALALDGDYLTWIASPGDVVLRISTSGGGQPTTLRDRGIFSDVASVSGEVFIAEAVAAGGALLRVTGPTAARLVSFEGSPRVVMADATHAYVTTPTKVFRTPHVKGELETIATGVAFGSAEADDAFVYIVTEQDKARVVVRFQKTGGPMTVVARDVRDAPIEIIGDELLYFDATKPQLRATHSSGGPARIVAESEAFSVVTAIEADATTVYVATGSRESAAILAVDRQ